MNKTAKAAVWKQIKGIPTKNQHCGFVLKFSGNTTHLIDHIRQCPCQNVRPNYYALLVCIPIKLCFYDTIVIVMKLSRYYGGIETTIAMLSQ